MICHSDAERVHRTHKKNCVRWMQSPDEIVPISPPDHTGARELLLMAAATAVATVAMAVVWWYCG